MTRVFTDGAEFGDLLFWTSPGSLTVSATSRSGVYSYYYSYGIKDIPDVSEFYLRIGVRDSSIGESASSTCFIPRVRNGTTTHAQLYFSNVDSKMHLDAGGIANVAMSSTAYISNTWYLIEMYLKIANSPDGRCIVKIDGIIEIDFTGDTQDGATTTADNLLIGATGYNSIWFDVLALNDN